MVDHVLVVTGFYLVFPIIGLHFVGQLGWSAASVGLALGARQMAQQGMALFGGSLSDRFGAKPLVVAGMLLRAGGFALMAFAANPAWLLASCVLSGLGGSLFEPARGALAAKLTRPAERQRFYSLLMMQESVSAPCCWAWTSARWPWAAAQSSSSLHWPTHGCCRPTASPRRAPRC
jgi:DHA1 family multidrug resistance protein-like MFS transporter